MKKSILLSFILLAVLLSCSVAPKVVIPDEPQYVPMQVYELEGLSCFDGEGVSALRQNVGALKGWADKLKAELERVRDGR